MSIKHFLISLSLVSLSAACQVGSVSDAPPPTSDYGQQASECADDAEACIATCLADHGVDLDGLEACAQDIADCIEANPDDPAACAPIAEACLGGDLEADAAALADCLATCSDDFGTCTPEPPDPADVPEVPELDELVECVEGTAGCFTDCGDALVTCEPPVVDCDPADLESLGDCIEAAGGDPAAVLECLEGAGGACEVPEPDLGCFEDSAACFESCLADLELCLEA